MKGQNKDHDSSNCTSLAVNSVPSPEVFRTRYIVNIGGSFWGQRWRSGESPRQCGPSSLPDPRCHTWVEFVVGSRLAPWVFLRGLRGLQDRGSVLLSKNFNSDFYFYSVPKIVGFHVDENS